MQQQMRHLVEVGLWDSAEVLVRLHSPQAYSARDGNALYAIHTSQGHFLITAIRKGDDAGASVSRAENMVGKSCKPRLFPYSVDWA